MKCLNILLATGLLLGSCATTAPADTQDTCAKRADVLSSLSDRFGEARQFIGLSDNATKAVELFVSEETGTWTIIVTLPNGVTCLVASGNGFQLIVDAPKGEPL